MVEGGAVEEYVVFFGFGLVCLSTVGWLVGWYVFLWRVFVALFAF